MLNSPNDRWKVQPCRVHLQVQQLSALRERDSLIILGGRTHLKELTDLSQIQVFFKMKSQYTIVLKLSDCILLSQAHRHRCQRFQAYRDKGRITVQVNSFPLPWLCFDHLSFTLYSSILRGIGRRTLKMGTTAARLLPLTSFIAFVGASFSLVFATCYQQNDYVRQRHHITYISQLSAIFINCEATSKKT